MEVTIEKCDVRPLMETETNGEIQNEFVLVPLGGLPLLRLLGRLGFSLHDKGREQQHPRHLGVNGLDEQVAGPSTRVRRRKARRKLAGGVPRSRRGASTSRNTSGDSNAARGGGGEGAERGGGRGAGSGSGSHGRLGRLLWFLFFFFIFLVFLDNLVFPFLLASVHSGCGGSSSSSFCGSSTGRGLLVDQEEVFLVSGRQWRARSLGDHQPGTTPAGLLGRRKK